MDKNALRLQKAQVIASLLIDSINQGQKNIPNSHLKLADIKEVADVFLATVRPSMIARFDPGEMEAARLEHLKESHCFPGLQYALATKLPKAASMVNTHGIALVVLMGENFIYEVYAFANGDAARVAMKNFVDIESHFPDGYFFRLSAHESGEGMNLQLNGELLDGMTDKHGNLPREVVDAIKGISEEFSPKNN